MNKKEKGIPIKRNMSSIQVLKTLQVLIGGDYTMSELIEKLNKNEPKPVFNNSVISKYINTCRQCGIKIPKINNKYYISCLPFGLYISDSEHDLITYLQQCAKDFLSKSANIRFEELIEKLSRYSDKQIETVKGVSVDRIRSMFEQAIKDERKVLLILRDNVCLECIPRDICENNGKFYFHVNHNDMERNIAISRVVGIEISRERVCKVREEGSVIFKLTGNLAKNYTLRENERIVTNGLPEYESVVNYNENTPILLSRLLKYGDLCEVKTPKHIREEFKAMIDKTLANYGEA